MAAHLRTINRPGCQYPGCTRKATQTLYNTWNAPCGDYCGSHARRALKDFWREHPDHAPFHERARHA